MSKTPGEIKNEITLIFPTQEDIENSNTLYIFIEDSLGRKQFIPVDCRLLKELTILTDKEEAIKKFEG